MFPIRFLITTIVFCSISFCGVAQNLTVWHTENDPNTLKAMDSIGKKFEFENPGVKISIVPVGWQDLYRRLTLSMQSGEVPDVTQIEPFMGAYLKEADFLDPIDDIFAKLPTSDIYPCVKDLQQFDGKHYGISTALGISYYAYRTDLISSDTFAPKDWNSLTSFVEKSTNDKVSPILLPSNDLHINLLFCELLASNEGSLFDSLNRPNFTSQKVLETLELWKTLYSKIPEKYRHNSYTDNFTAFSKGESMLMPNFFGRGLTSIERNAEEQFRSPKYYSFFSHVIGPEGSTAYATLDAEAWTIPQKAKNKELARKFLLFFYREDNYLIFCNSVPIHLTPIFKNLAENKYKENPFIQKWQNFYDYELDLLNRGHVLPIFMTKREHRLLPALFKLEGTGVISGMVRNVTEKNISPLEAAKIAETKAKDLEPASPVVSPISINWKLILGASIILLFVFLLIYSRKKS